MKKILIICLFFIANCAYQPIFLNKNLKNFEFNKIITEGEKRINEQVINSAGIKGNGFDDSLNELLLITTFNVEETSKNSKGQVQSYRSIITINVIITKNKKIIKRKKFSDQFSYNKKDNRSELIQYQNEIKENLVDKTLEEIVLFLNL